MLAGVSTDWYTRLEKGHIGGVSEDVLDAVARALRLDEAERAHLFDLARAARPSRAPRRQHRNQVRPSLQRVVDAMVAAPAFVRNGRLDLLAINTLGRALYAPVFDDPSRPANLARFNFLDPRARDFYPNWDDAAHTSVALLRTEAGRDPHNRDLTALVGELATRSGEFRARWAAHNVRLHQRGSKSFNHPSSGPSSSPSTPWTCPPTPGSPLPSTPPTPVRPRKTACGSSPAGPLPSRPPNSRRPAPRPAPRPARTDDAPAPARQAHG